MGATGPAASLGIHYKNAFQLMPKTIAGHPVKVIMYEDKTDATEAAKNAQAHTEDNVDAVMGSVSVPSTTQVAQIANEFEGPDSSRPWRFPESWNGCSWSRSPRR
jgi:branched-chain amino acid transport system substrate-binding protein